ncbi:iron-containing alcohol dehydrogenase [Puniceibacterium sp. IMCC21224]|uniref:iron-containing alcohol dehydrogenase n=1 Tax=Puniceibacterium sp. IMCC21224 TaxID=1618204 RepID=UPI00064D9061|nr:iron-containing alcohol dehydrogenase [Puniceibacterium sp. IMCC21224]KMK64924.1 Fe-dependent oxidoreductase, alcohol dehydrogenase [Puniceibacterium sp. IMCC21224]
MKFDLCIPTDIRFGTGQIASLDTLIPPAARVLLLYGGGSIFKNGIHQQVRTALGDRAVTEFGGIEPNPAYETLQQASVTARSAGVDLVLGVGGGSVIDAAKFLSVMIGSGDDDPWDRFIDGYDQVSPVPNGAVLTLPATGSESNPVSVISNKTRQLKLPFASQSARPAFAIMDPSSMLSLSTRQLQNGVVDSFTHVLEQYLTTRVNAPVQYGFSEAILEVLIDWGPKLVEDRSLDACENVMWAANQALNGLIGAGVPQDWSTHMIGHAITALHGLDHARTLTMIMPSLMRYKLEDKLAMLARFGRRVWKIDGTDDRAVAEEAIRRTEVFMSDMSCPVRISEALNDFDPDALIRHLEAARQTSLGENADIGPNQVRAILKIAA